jgi:NADH-quinone oxidoreductase subunit F
MHELAGKIQAGKGSLADIALLKKLGGVMSIACLCGLGQAAPTPVLTTLDHFAADYEDKLV